MRHPRAQGSWTTRAISLFPWLVGAFGSHKAWLIHFRARLTYVLRGIRVCLAKPFHIDYQDGRKRVLCIGAEMEHKKAFSSDSKAEFLSVFQVSCLQ